MFHTSVHLKVDNATPVAWINKQTAPIELEFYIVKQIWNFAAKRKLEIYTSYIESKKSKIADFESGNILEWALKDHVFMKVKKSQVIIYAFPPFNLIPRVLQKMENEKTEEILIVPIFFNQSWFTRLFTLLIKETLWLPSSGISLTFPYRKSIPYLP